MDAKTPKLVKEVWRTPGGTFAKAPEQPVEEPLEKTKENGNVILGIVMLIPGVIVLAVLFWQITLSIGAVAGMWSGYKYLKQKQGEQLIINWYK